VVLVAVLDRVAVKEPVVEVIGGELRRADVVEDVGFAVVTW
jgi:hypothetical protein